MTEAVLIKEETELSGWLANSQNNGKLVQTKLDAHDRVIARVTDGIYRQPSSALRELISNAWDADATNVTILTDAPRFSRIYVRDDGIGMSYATLARLLKNIGGSAKRRDEGAGLGISKAGDTERTQGGRLIIGKIGIGLFSISQLSRRFQIITKVKGTDYRLIAEIKLRQYDDQAIDDITTDAEDDYISGDVVIRREYSADVDAHGTDIILDDLKSPVRDILRSADRWRAVADKDAAIAAKDMDAAASIDVTVPAFHSGYIAQMGRPSDGPIVLTRQPKLPWDADDPSEIRMSKLMDAVEGESSQTDRPDLAKTLDTYLAMIWELGLSAPVPYVDKHPFDLEQNGEIQLFWLTEERGRGQEVPLLPGVTVREAIKQSVKGAPELKDGIDPIGRFNVTIDGVALRRPIRFKFRKTEKRGLEKAVLFVGRFQPELSKIPAAQRGGSLCLEAYLFWTGKVIPKENNGVLVRIRGASGALFDPQFVKYQVSEQTRLRQITSELFVRKGLDAALNIDRESFNFAHPHLQLVGKWLHGAIRQLTNRLKDEAQKLRTVRQEEVTTASNNRVTTEAAQVWKVVRGDDPLPHVVLASTPQDAQKARYDGSIAILRERLPPLRQNTPDATAREAQVTALVQVLAAYRILEDRPYEEQQELIRAILNIFVGTDS